MACMSQGLGTGSAICLQKSTSLGSCLHNRFLQGRGLGCTQAPTRRSSFSRRGLRVSAEVPPQELATGSRTGSAENPGIEDLIICHSDSIDLLAQKLDKVDPSHYAEAVLELATLDSRSAAEIGRLESAVLEELQRSQLETQGSKVFVDLSHERHHVTIHSRSQRLTVHFDGFLELAGVSDCTDTVISTGQVELPAQLQDPHLWEVAFLDDERSSVRISWGDKAALKIVPAGEDLSHLFPAGCKKTLHDHSWAEKLDEGFVCEFSVSRAAAERDMVEVVLDMHVAGYWFGGGHYMRQHWPLDLGEFEVGPFFPFDNGPNGTNTLISPQWMTSRGLLVLANPDTPFFHVGLNAPRQEANDGWIQRKWGVGVQNLNREYLPRETRGRGDGKLRLQARGSYKCFEMLHPLRDWMPHGPFERHECGSLSLQFAISAHRNVKEACLAGLKTLKKPPNPPNKEMVDAPIWTTWARYHAKVNQAKVEQFANEIVTRGLQRSVMEIDDKWQSKYGDFDFDPVKFPDPKAMVELLHALGFKVTLWIMPFAEEASKAYQEGAPKGYFIKSDGPATRGLKPGFFHWWQPVPAAALDVTNPEAVDWFVSRLKKLQDEIKIDGFKFDAGEPCFLPARFKTHTPIASPTEYTRLYVQEVASKFEYSEVRTGHKTTSVPLLTRMGDRFSTWSSGNGLRSVIPTLLTSGLLGYPFCLPDMIGGNAYFGRKPDVELLVRWAQANALMPAMQFSIAPWDLSAEADRLCKAVLDIRSKVTSYIFCVMEEACKKLTPVCRPMWWLDPEDQETFLIDDQFAIGDDIIVAPVVVKGQKKRDVYLPKGTWMELLNPLAQIEGPVWLRQIDAPLHKIPIYRRIHVVNDEDAANLKVYVGPTRFFFNLESNPSLPNATGTNVSECGEASRESLQIADAEDDVTPPSVLC